jgi:hypothetical protein
LVKEINMDIACIGGNASVSGNLVYGDERVVAIVYEPNLKGELIPFSIFTACNDNPNSGHREYDFEYCKQDQSLCFHFSGMGAGFYLNKMAFQEELPRAAVWWDRDVVSPKDGGAIYGTALSDES